MGKTGNPTPQFFIMKNSHPLQPCPEHVYPFLEGNIMLGNPHGKFPRSN
jgi:hypothetical protein